jgi:PAS domain S-box-containing protein
MNVAGTTQRALLLALIVFVAAFFLWAPVTLAQTLTQIEEQGFWHLYHWPIITVLLALQAIVIAGLLQRRKKQAQRERLAALEERKIAEENFSRIFSVSPLRMGILRVSDGAIMAVNDQWLNDFGYSLEEVVGKPIFEFHEELGPDVHELVRNALRAQKPVRNLEFRIKIKGEERSNVTNAELVDFRGERCFLWATNDITEHTRAEDALKRNEELFRAIVEDQSEMIVRWKPDGIRTFVNRAYSRVFGGEPKDFIGTSFYPLIAEKYREGIRAKVKSLTPENPTATEVHESVAANNEISWQEWTDRGIFDDEGHLIELQSTGRDITERKRAEDALRTSEEQLRALSARIHSAREEEGTRIAREIHDELGGALTGLRWELEGIDKTLASATNGNRVPHIREKIATMTERIDSTIRTVRRISSDLRPGILDDLGPIAAIEWQSQQFQQRTGINCVCESSVDDVELNRDRATAVFRIFQEILTNVLRHAQATHVEVNMWEHEGRFFLEVTDNGSGITAQQERNRNSLGLLGMRERAHLVGGDIKITGVSGRGTTVMVCVPTN